MPMVWKSVLSSRVAEIGYDPETKTLGVRWPKGKTSVYEDVPEDVANRIMNAPSIGQALQESILGEFDHRYT